MTREWRLGKDSIIAIICMIITNSISIGITYYSGISNLENLMVQLRSYKSESIRQNKIALYSKLYCYVQLLPKFNDVPLSENMRKKLPESLELVLSTCNSLYAISCDSEKFIIDDIKKLTKILFQKLIIKDAEKYTYDSLKKIEKYIIADDIEQYFTDEFRKIYNKVKLLGVYIIEDKNKKII